MRRQPRIAITVGDPAGIGPEIARRAADDPRVLDVCQPILYAPAPDQAFSPGVLSAEAGRAAFDTIVRASEDAPCLRRSAKAARIAGFPSTLIGWRMAPPDPHF